MDEGKINAYITGKYPQHHTIKTSKALYEYAHTIKNKYLKKSPPLSKVYYSDKKAAIENALGLHKFIVKQHGNKSKSTNEIEVSSMFIDAPELFLELIVVHELAHFKEKDHNKAFYNLCRHIMPDYHLIELDMRIFLASHV